MRQLVQLNQHAEDFKKLNADVVIVFREDQREVEGLKEIRSKRKTKFTLLTDLGAKHTAAYSPKKMRFATYVIDRKGVVRDILEGSLRQRPVSEPILKVLAELEKPASGSKPQKGKADGEKPAGA